MYELFSQTPDETYTINAQILMLDIVLNLKVGQVLDIKTLKSKAETVASKMTDDKDFDHLRDELLGESVRGLKT